jgi:hypothetical protein
VPDRPGIVKQDCCPTQESIAVLPHSRPSNLRSGLLITRFHRSEDCGVAMTGTYTPMVPTHIDDDKSTCTHTVTRGKRHQGITSDHLASRSMAEIRYVLSSSSRLMCIWNGTWYT